MKNNNTISNVPSITATLRAMNKGQVCLIPAALMPGANVAAHVSAGQLFGAKGGVKVRRDNKGNFRVQLQRPIPKESNGKISLFKILPAEPLFEGGRGRPVGTLNSPSAKKTGPKVSKAAKKPAKAAHKAKKVVSKASPKPKVAKKSAPAKKSKAAKLTKAAPTPAFLK